MWPVTGPQSKALAGNHTEVVSMQKLSHRGAMFSLRGVMIVIDEDEGEDEDEEYGVINQDS